MKKQLNILQQISAFNAGKYDSPKVKVQIEAGWIDWFCHDRLLYKKTKELYAKVQQIVSSNKFDAECCYITLNNIYPNVGDLFDTFCICDISTSKVLYGVIPEYKVEVFHGAFKKISEVLIFDQTELTYKQMTKESWDDLIVWFNENTNK